MRILVVSDLPRGRQRFVDDSVDALRKAGHIVAAISLRDARGFDNGPGLCSAHGLSTQVVPKWYQFPLYFILRFAIMAAATLEPRLAAFLTCAADFDTFGRLLGTGRAIRYLGAKRAIAAFDPGAVHIHFAWNVKHILPIANYLELPIVVTAHGSDILMNSEWREILCRDEIATIACVSVHLKNTIDQVPVLSSKTLIVRNPIAPVFCVPPVEAPKRFEIVCVAALRTLKNHAWLLRALKLLKDNDVKFQCILIGAPMQGQESHANALKAMVAELGLSDHVEFAGWRDQDAVRQALDEASVLVLPSNSEGFGMCIIEALSRKRCAVVSDIPGCREAVQDGAYGIVVPLNEDRQLADALLEAHRITCEDAERMRQAREYAMTSFSPTAHAVALTGVLSSVIDSSRRRIPNGSN